MLSAVSRFVSSISNGFLILPTISCLVFVVFSAVLSIYVAHGVGGSHCYSSGPSDDVASEVFWLVG